MKDWVDVDPAQSGPRTCEDCHETKELPQFISISGNQLCKRCMGCRGRRRARRQKRVMRRKEMLEPLLTMNREVQTSQATVMQLASTSSTFFKSANFALVPLNQQMSTEPSESITETRASVESGNQIPKLLYAFCDACGLARSVRLVDDGIFVYCLEYELKYCYFGEHDLERRCFIDRKGNEYPRCNKCRQYDETEESEQESDTEDEAEQEGEEQPEEEVGEESGEEPSEGSGEGSGEESDEEVEESREEESRESQYGRENCGQQAMKHVKIEPEQIVPNLKVEDIKPEIKQELVEGVDLTAFETLPLKIAHGRKFAEPFVIDSD